MQPSVDEFRDWLGHPVTEWIIACMTKAAASQKAKWAEIAWDKGETDPMLLKEAQVRADCYMALPESSFADWKAIDDSED